MGGCRVIVIDTYHQRHQGAGERAMQPNCATLCMRDARGGALIGEFEEERKKKKKKKRGARALAALDCSSESHSLPCCVEARACAPQRIVSNGRNRPPGQPSRPLSNSCTHLKFS